MGLCEVLGGDGAEVLRVTISASDCREGARLRAGLFYELAMAII